MENDKIQTSELDEKNSPILKKNLQIYSYTGEMEFSK